MKKKIVGILVMMLLITTALPAVGTMNDYKPLNVQQDITPISTKGDETTVTLYPTGDATVAEGYPDTNYGTDTSLYLQSFTEDFKNERIYLKFDLSSIPEGATVTDVTFRLYCYSAKFAMVIGNLYGYTVAWLENTITWNNQPCDPEYDPLLAGRNMTFGDEFSWCEWGGLTLTGYVQESIPLDDLGLMVKTEPESVSGQYIFNSREYGERIPELVITYIDPPLPVPEIKVTGGFLGYQVTVKNVGDETVSGNLSMTITTDAPIMILGGELSAETPDVIELDPGQETTIPMRPVLGFGPAKITVSCSYQVGDGPWEYSGNTTGFVFLFYVIGTCEIMPDPIP